MAAASAALSGHPAVVLATRAVGAANLAIGLHVAFADSLPVVALVGQVPRSTRGREAFQEVDLAATIGGYCRWAREVRDVASLPGILDEALRRATTGRPGPVLLSLPEDLLAEMVAEAPARTAPTLGPSRTPPADPAHVRRILHLLLDAERPVILAGGGVLRSRATADLVRLAEFVDVPVIATWRRPDVFPNDNPRYLGMTGFFAAPTVRRRLEDADAILVIGSRLNEIASYHHAIPAEGTPWAHVDVEPLVSRPGLAAPTIALAADARTFLREARRVLGAGVLDAAGLERRRAAMAADRAAYEDARRVDEETWDGPGIHPGRIVATLNRVLSPDTIITTDAGNFGGWAARGLILRRPGTFLGTTAGAMGFAIPAAVAASLAGPGRPVVALAGDGGRRDDDRGARDRRSLRRPSGRAHLRQRTLRHDPRPPGAAGLRAGRDRPRSGRLGPRRGGLRCPRIARIEQDDDFEPALRAALVRDPPDGPPPRRRPPLGRGRPGRGRRASDREWVARSATGGCRGGLVARLPARTDQEALVAEAEVAVDERPSSPKRPSPTRTRGRRGGGRRRGGPRDRRGTRRREAQPGDLESTVDPAPASEPEPLVSASTRTRTRPS